MCRKSFPSKKLLDKHSIYHVEKNSTCKHCGKLFYKRWLLDQHMALDHDEEFKEPPVECQECDKRFKWRRNLLAHVLVYHPTETRYRCRFCPLTFLKKPLYFKHHCNKHSDKPKTWCTVRKYPSEQNDL